MAGPKRATLTPKGENPIVTNGCVFLHRNEEPLKGFGLITPGRVGYGSAYLPFITTSPPETSLKKGETHEVKYVMVSVANPPELEAVTEAFKRDEPVNANVLVSNPTSRRLEATLSLKIPKGWQVQPAEAPVSLDSGKAAVVGFNFVATESAVAGHHRVEAVLALRGGGEIREKEKVKLKDK